MKKSNSKIHLALLLGLFFLAACNVTNPPGQEKSKPDFGDLAPTPPMGWNSYDNFNNQVTEEEVKANADYVETHLKKYGYEYIVVDILWYLPKNVKSITNWDEILELDEYGRPIPSLDKFPSAANGKGLKPLADYIHGKGLKFGLHIMRGITREAVHKNLPVFGTPFKASDIVNTYDTCNWYTQSYGVNMTKAGAQEFYNSLFKMYAEWEVDFIKADDMTSPHHADEIEAVRKAIDQCGRPMLLSLSPGPAFVGAAKHLEDNANMWRISNDFWDSWPALRHMFDLCHNWTGSIKPGHWPDADMIPLGKVGTGMDEPRFSNFTTAEKYTMMSLWSIFRSPLMLGGNLPENDSLTVQLITNEEVLSVNQASLNNREIELNKAQCIYAADVPDSKDQYIAVFNFSDTKALPVTVSLTSLGISGKVIVRDLWAKKDLGEFEDEFSPVIDAHGGGLFRIKVK